MRRALQDIAEHLSILGLVDAQRAFPTQEVLRMMRLWRKHVGCERGAELIEYIGMVPLLLTVGLIIWQFMLAGHTMLITASAAREGARAFALCPPEDPYGAATRASPGFNDRQIQPEVGSNGYVAVTVRLKIPLVLRGPYVIAERMPWTRYKAVMRRERCTW